MKEKTVEVRLEEEIQYSPDKKSLIGSICIENTEINFHLLLSNNKTEYSLVLLNGPRESIRIEVKNSRKNFSLQEFEYKIFHDYFLGLANKFFKSRTEFRKNHKETKSEGPIRIRFVGKVELKIQFCQVLNRNLGLNINIPRTKI
ncbi:MAG: hypothetical protein PF572_01740 [Patescibacteria group bacterium]|jgi:hypothetical protein|nr:hypothetical protein [Patescibacteria group bacterium]